MASKRTSTSADPWVAEVEKSIAAFAVKYARHYAFRDRELAGAFEIGCFLAMIADYERQGLTVTLRNLEANEFRYLTTPNGDPNNFSFVELRTTKGSLWQLRQQVRVRSHLHSDITFTPDIVLIDGAATISESKDPDYAGGKRTFFSVSSDGLVAAHECKSMPGFPELYVSFIGMLLAAHRGLGGLDGAVGGLPETGPRGHLAPTLFVGGEASNLHRKMIAALQQVYPMNIITGLHRGGWVVIKRSKELRRLPLDPISRTAGATPTIPTRPPTVSAPAPTISTASKKRLMLPNRVLHPTRSKGDDDDIPF